MTASRALVIIETTSPPGLCAQRMHTRRRFVYKRRFSKQCLENWAKKKCQTMSGIFVISFVISEEQEFTAQSALSWGQVKEGSQMALFSFISLSMRLPFSRSRTSPYATLHNLPAIWCKSGVAVGVVDFRPKCPVYRSDLQRNGLWLPWWLLRKSPSWC